MMKIVILLLAAALSFAACLALLLLATGNLNQDALNRLMGKESDVAQEQKQGNGNTASSVGTLAERLKQRELELDAKEKRLAEQEEQLAESEARLQQLRNEIGELNAEVLGVLDDQKKQREIRLQSWAVRLQSMKATKAAEHISSLVDESPEDAAAVLNMIDSDESGKIMDALDPDDLTSIYREMRRLPAS